MIALSSAEAEYISLSEYGKQLMWAMKLFWEVINKTDWKENTRFNLTKIFIDSTAAISMATNDQELASNKHIEIKIHHVRALLKKKINCSIICNNQTECCKFIDNSARSPNDEVFVIMSRIRT